MDSVEKAAQLLAEARYAVALTGAGISTPSGIPDFRSPGTGLWEKYDPMEVATIWAFRRDPKKFYEWFRPRVDSFLAAQPNPAHTALADLENMGILKAVITQNIDGLHQRAGSRQVIELHGNGRQAACMDCGREYAAEVLWGEYKKSGEVPQCRDCGGLIKPKVILFGEVLPPQALDAAWEEARKCDLMLVVGSSLEVTPAAGLPYMARDHGARLIIVNLQPTPADHLADAVIREDVARALPAIAEFCRRASTLSK